MTWRANGGAMDLTTLLMLPVAVLVGHFAVSDL